MLLVNSAPESLHLLASAFVILLAIVPVPATNLDLFRPFFGPVRVFANRGTTSTPGRFTCLYRKLTWK